MTVVLNATNYNFGQRLHKNPSISDTLSQLGAERCGVETSHWLAAEWCMVTSSSIFPADEMKPVFEETKIDFTGQKKFVLKKKPLDSNHV